ncbi:hypothetical protein [Polaromonas sp.]|uniref:hypothetical protein n=1 Tax=Polaromonas sp. TaxID=1869339 RepID=UPI002FCC1CB8
MPLFPVVGASLLSAAASLPLHLMPLVVVAVVAESRLAEAQAGWIASAYMLGQLFAVLALPGIKVSRILRWQALVAVAVLLVTLWVSKSPQRSTLLLSWLVIGMICGTLHFSATATAAATTDRRTAFALRMAMSSLVGGSVIVGLQLMRGLVSYSALATQLTVAFAVIAGVGLLLYRAPEAMGSAPLLAESEPAKGAVPRTRASLGRLAGLFVLFVLFVGQHGLWAFAVQGAQQRGVMLDHVAYAVAACKLIAGAVVLASVVRHSSTRPDSPYSLLISGLSVMVGGAGFAFTENVVIFWLALLSWEVGFSVLSARLQAMTAQDNPRMAGMWMTGAIFLGAATGPALSGLIIRADLFWAYVVFAGVSALIPHGWAVVKAQEKPHFGQRVARYKTGE